MLTIRARDIASVWSGPHPVDGWQVVVTHQSGAKSVLSYRLAEDAERDHLLLQAVMAEASDTTAHIVGTK